MTSLPGEQFWEACGAKPPMELIVRGPKNPQGERHPLHLPFAVIGRDPNVDLQLDHPHVNRRHAYLQVLDGRLFCVDLQSRTGTHWEDGSAQGGWIWGDRGARIGPYTVRAAVRDDDPGIALEHEFHPFVIRGFDNGGLPDLTLEFFRGTERALTWRMNRALALVGRSDSCKVRLKDASVAPFHCSLVSTSQGIWVVDLLGEEGISLNGRPVRWAALHNGDQLKVGKFSILMRADKPSNALPPPGHEKPKALSGPSRHPSLPVSFGQLEGQMPASFPMQTAMPTGFDSAIFPLSETFSPESAMALGNTLPKSEFTHSVLVPLLNQFASMQHQMFDQFQQTILMMVQMFSSLHKDQLGLIRQELDQLRDLTRELSELQTELAKKPASAGEAQPSPSGPDVPEPAERPVAAHVAPSSARPAANGVTPKPAEKPGFPAAPAPAAPRPEYVAPTAGLPEPPAGVQSDQEIHVWLYDRIAAIQKERQSRWQTIVNYVMGK